MEEPHKNHKITLNKQHESDTRIFSSKVISDLLA